LENGTSSEEIAIMSPDPFAPKIPAPTIAKVGPPPVPDPGPPVITQAVNGHFVSASSVSVKGKTIGITFPAFPDQNSLTYTMDGAPDLTISLSFTQTTFTIAAKVAAKSIESVITPGDWPTSIPAFVTAGGGASSDAPNLVTNLNHAIVDFACENFDGDLDFDFDRFKAVCKEAAGERSPPHGLNPVFAVAWQSYTQALAGGAANPAPWGAYSRGIIWGAAAVGAACALPSEAAPVSILGSFGAFALGFDASVLSELVSFVSDGQRGGGKPPSSPGQPGQPPSGPLTIDLPDRPVQK
jgi:hypothetical protein